MAKKATATKKTEPKKAHLDEVSNKVTIESVKDGILLASKTWAEWKDLSSWEKKSKKAKKEWKEDILKYTLEVAKKIVTTKPKYFEGADNKKYENFLHECKRRIYQSKYVPIAKPAKTSSTKGYNIFILQQSQYFDWGARNYDIALKSYVDGSEAEQAIMEQKDQIKLKTDAVGNITETIPMMKWGKGRKPIPKHAYMGSAIGAAMPTSDYEEAMKEGDESKLWNSLMPCVIDLSSNTQKNIHFGDPSSDKYIQFEPLKCYKGDFYAKRGKKTTVGDDTIYLFEGKKTTDDDGVVSYDGQRSFQYDIAPSPSSTIEEISVEEFNIDGGIDYFIEDVIFDTWKSVLEIGEKKMHGLAAVPEFFAETNIQRSPKSERLDALHPVAFECDVLDAFKSEPDEELENQVIFRRLRLDDQLDSKFDDDENDFVEITIGANNLSEDQIKIFDDLAENSRIKVIATLYRPTAEDMITGECLWFDILKSTAIGEDVLSDDIFSIEENDEEISILEEDSEEEELEEDSEEKEPEEELEDDSEEDIEYE